MTSGNLNMKTPAHAISGRASVAGADINLQQDNLNDEYICQID